MKVLLPFAWLYSFVMWVRNRAFDWRILKTTKVGIPVISVGNLTVGGTGKTPLVEYIVRYLLEQGRRVGVVSRGYGRKSSGVVVVSDGLQLLVGSDQGGDEPVQIAGKFPGLIVVVGERKVEAAQRARELGADTIIVDDGFQHRYLHRDLDIVVVDSTSDLTNDAVLPAGRLREPLSGLRRANMVVFSKVDERIVRDIDSKVRPYFRGAIIKFRYRITKVQRAADSALVSFEVVRRMKLLAFSGIGKHEAFINELHKNGFELVSDMRFSDHHPYSEGDMSTLISFARGVGADGFITTEKDAVRLRANGTVAQVLFAELPVFYAEIEVEMLEGQAVLNTAIENCGTDSPV